MEKECFEMLLLLVDLIRGDLLHKDQACKRAAAHMLNRGGSGTEPCSSIVQPLASLLSGSAFRWIPDDIWIAIEVYQTASRISEDPALFDADAHARLMQFAEDLSTVRLADSTSTDSGLSAGSQVAEGVRSVGRNLHQVLRRISPSTAATAGVTEVKDLLRALRRVAVNRAVVALVLLTVQLKQRCVKVQTVYGDAPGGPAVVAMSDADVAAANELFTALVPFSASAPPSVSMHHQQPIRAAAAAQGDANRAATRKRDRENEATPNEASSSAADAATVGSSSTNSAPPPQQPTAATTTAVPSSSTFEEALLHAFDTPMRVALPSRRGALDETAAVDGPVQHPSSTAADKDSDGSATEDDESDASVSSLPTKIALRGTDMSAADSSLLQHDNDEPLFDPNVSKISHANDRSAASSGIDVSVVCDVERARPIKPRPAILRAHDDQCDGRPAATGLGYALSGSRKYFLDPASHRFYPVSIAGFFD